MEAEMTVEGIVSLSRLQSWNAFSSIDVTLNIFLNIPLSVAQRNSRHNMQHIVYASRQRSRFRHYLSRRQFALTMRLLYNNNHHL